MLSSSEWLNNEDSRCFDDRLSRLQWFADRLPEAEYWTFPGGLLAKSLFDEMRYCFVYAQFLAANLLGLAYIERTLAALFYGAGRNDLKRAGISRLLKEAQAYGLISNSEFQGLERIRKKRNAHAHFRRPGHGESGEARSILGDITDYEVIENDATAVVAAALHIVDKNSV